MLGKISQNTMYVGPKALFDPYYIPPKLLHRKKEQDYLHNILNDSIEDHFSLNVLYQGINGIGKKVIVNKVIQDIIKDPNNTSPFFEMRIDCREKSFEELMVSMFFEFNKHPQISYDLDSLINANLLNLWNKFKLTCTKISKERNIFMIFNNVEDLDPKFFKKFLRFSKELNISTISTVNKILRTSTLELLNEFDLKEKLRYFRYKELFTILKQRIKLSFPNPVDEDAIHLISDLIFENYVPVPGKGIDILRNIYPYLNGNSHVESFELLQLCQNQFENNGNIDEFSLLSFISEEDLINIIFLDNLSNFFINSHNFYISREELSELYDLSMESLEYRKNEGDFESLLTTSQRIGVLCPSKKNERNINQFFIGINPKQLKAIVDAIFNKI